MKKISIFALLLICGVLLSGCIIKKPEEVLPNYQHVHSKILTIDESSQRLELLNYGTFNYTSDLKVYHIINDKLQEITVDDLYIGQENVYLQLDEENDIKVILVDNKIGFNNIRVAIRKDISDITDDDMLYHDDVVFTLNTNSKIYTIDNEFVFDLKKGQQVNIKPLNSKMRVFVDQELLFETVERIILEPPLVTYTTTFNSIKRALGTPSYKGILEVALINNRLLVINDLPIELYLENVLPSEMLASFSLEALKAQAVAARTYAYKDILNKTNQKYGFAVDDSTKSQVYNNQASHVNTNSAIRATKGLVMMNSNVPIDAFYYSTSSGLTASAHEVWITSNTLPPVTNYLIGQNLATFVDGSPVEYDYQSEDSMLDFFKMIDCVTPDLTKYHRWRLGLNNEQIRNILNNTLAKMYHSTPNLILTLNQGEFISKDIPEDIGEVLDIYVSKRGESGVVISLDIKTSKTTYRIINQYNIRFSLRPHINYAGSTVLIQFSNLERTGYDAPSNGPTSLPSGFFAIENNGDIYTFYGGGFGHGVGMSQYGANGLGNQGKTYKEILNTYYHQVDFVDISYTYRSNDNIEEVFKLLYA